MTLKTGLNRRRIGYCGANKREVACCGRELPLLLHSVCWAGGSLPQAIAPLQLLSSNGLGGVLGVSFARCIRVQSIPEPSTSLWGTGEGEALRGQLGAKGHKGECGDGSLEKSELVSRNEVDGLVQLRGKKH